MFQRLRLLRDCTGGCIFWTAGSIKQLQTIAMDHPLTGQTSETAMLQQHIPRKQSIEYAVFMKAFAWQQAIASGKSHSSVRTHEQFTTQNAFITSVA